MPPEFVIEIAGSSCVKNTVKTGQLVIENFVKLKRITPFKTTHYLFKEIFNNILFKETICVRVKHADYICDSLLTSAYKM